MGREIWITHAKGDDLSPKIGPSSPSEADLNNTLLIKLGVPYGAIVNLPGQASSTYEEAELVSSWKGTTGEKNLNIPTDPFHTLRVKWIFNKLVVAKGNKVTVRPIPSGVYSPERWWQSSDGRSYFRDEVVKYIYYQFRY